MRKLTLLLFLLLPLAAQAQNQIQAAPLEPPLTLNSLGRATLPIDGPWQFHTGDNLAWASPEFDDATWQPVLTGQSWESQGHRNYTGFAWYRRHLTIAAAGLPASMLALYLPRVEDAAEVYWNGVLVGSVGKVPPHPSWYIRPAPQVFTLGPAQSGVLSIRVWSAPYIYLSSPEEGGLVAVPQIGTTQAIAGLQTAARYRWLRSNQYRLAETLISTLVSIFALLAWLRKRDRRVLFWLAFALLDQVATLFTFDVPGFASFRLAYAVIGEINLGHSIAIWFLLLYLLELRDRRRLVEATRIMAIANVLLVAVDTVMVQFDWTRLFPHFFLLADVASTIPAILSELFGVVIIAFALPKRLDAARWMLATSVILSELLVGVEDMTGLGARWTHWTLARKLATPLFTLAGNRFALREIIETLLLLSLLYAAWRYSEEQGQRQSLIEQEFRSAQELQRLLIPEKLPEILGYAITSAYVPAQEVGGDFFQWIALPANAALLVIGDVSGKGLRAAMTVSLIVGSIRSTVETTNDPAAVLAALNRRLHGRLHGGFATCLVLHLDAGGNCRIANAGHLPPFQNGREVELQPALPLGLTADAEYEHTAFHLAPGSHLTLYTDGLLEARNPTGELFGFDRIAALLTPQAEAANHLDAQQIANTAVTFGQDDDITILTLTRNLDPPAPER